MWNELVIRFSIRKSNHRFWPSWHLLAPSQKWKHQNNMWNLFKVYNKDTRTTTTTFFWCLYCQLWTDFTHFSGSYCSGWGTLASVTHLKHDSDRFLQKGFNCLMIEPTKYFYAFSFINFMKNQKKNSMKLNQHLKTPVEVKWNREI